MSARNFFLLGLIMLCSFFAVVQVKADGAEEGGKCTQLLNTVCSDCHNTDRICDSLGETQDQWKTLIDSMISNGAELSGDAQSVLVECLSKPFAEAKKVCKK